MTVRHRIESNDKEACNSMNTTQQTVLNGTPCIQLTAGGYEAYIAYEIGSNVIRLRDVRNNIDVFRFSPDNTPETLRASAEVWGLPTLYLPNRFADGVLKTSDAVYHLPVNEPEPWNNHIHGFLHKRDHSVVSHYADENCAVVKTEYIYDENDPFFQYLPVKFRAELTFTLSAYGLEHKIALFNLSEKMMPISVATHTTIQAPFLDGAKAEDMRLMVPIGKRCELNERCLPTERLLEPKLSDLEYKNGTKVPVLQNIDNDMYQAENGVLDGQRFYGAVVEDAASGKKICYQISGEYRFWIIWNDKGFNGYFCPEPMTAMIDAPNLSLPADVTGYVEIRPYASFEAYQRFFTA